MAINVEQAFAQHLPFINFQLSLAVGIHAQNFFLCQSFQAQKIFDQRCNRCVFAHHEHLGVTAWVDLGKVLVQLAQLRQSGA